MNYLYIIVLVFSIFGPSNGQGPNEGIKVIMDIFSRMFDKNCTIQQDAMKAMGIMQCVGDTRDPGTPFNQEQFQKTCNNRQSTNNCLVGAMDLIKPCLAKDFKDLPNEITTAFNEYYNSYCKKSWTEAGNLENKLGNCTQNVIMSWTVCAKNENKPETKSYKCHCDKVKDYKICFENAINDADMRKANNRLVGIFYKVFSTDAHTCSLSASMSIFSLLGVLLTAFGAYYIIQL